MLNFIEIIIGNNNVISTSKIRKIIAIRKKCNENGRRVGDFGSNPHSKGEFFSRSEIVFLAVKFNRIINMIIIIMIMVLIIDKIKIIRTIF